MNADRSSDPPHTATRREGSIEEKQVQSKAKRKPAAKMRIGKKGIGKAATASAANVPTTMAIANGYSILPLTEPASNSALHLYIARQVHHEQLHQRSNIIVVINSDETMRRTREEVRRT